MKFWLRLEKLLTVAWPRNQPCFSTRSNLFLLFEKSQNSRAFTRWDCPWMVVRYAQHKFKMFNTILKIRNGCILMGFRRVEAILISADWSCGRIQEKIINLFSTRWNSTAMKPLGYLKSCKIAAHPTSALVHSQEGTVLLVNDRERHYKPFLCNFKTNKGIDWLFHHIAVRFYRVAARCRMLSIHIWTEEPGAEYKRKQSLFQVYR